MTEWQEELQVDWMHDLWSMKWNEYKKKQQQSGNKHLGNVGVILQ